MDNSQSSDVIERRSRMCAMWCEAYDVIAAAHGEDGPDWER